MAAIVSAVLGLTSFIDKKLNQSAEQQVVTFTEQSASNVTDRMYMSQNAIGAFTVQTTDPALVAPALSSFQEHHGFANATFAGMDGRGVRADGSAFSVDELAQPKRLCPRVAVRTLPRSPTRRRPRASRPNAALYRWAASRSPVRAGAVKLVLYVPSAGYVRRPRLLHVVRGFHRRGAGASHGRNQDTGGSSHVAVRLP